MNKSNLLLIRDNINTFNKKELRLIVLELIKIIFELQW